MISNSYGARKGAGFLRTFTPRSETTDMAAKGGVYVTTTLPLKREKLADNNKGVQICEKGRGDGSDFMSREDEGGLNGPQSGIDALPIIDRVLAFSRWPINVT